ncbi:hypothetical protein Ahy_B05g078102 [Arachis hypogaea]|uniref:ATP-dependent DNA helicase n=1 Tax=Arachis hypogaea TaxID=3818 RepID=A0A444Z6C4_ARAHY|nr:hypothetical protein Ahy_B05g078102 [Arachis hypogaea]
MKLKCSIKCDLKHLIGLTDQYKTYQPFGGKVVVLGRCRHDILSSAINSFHLWLFRKVLKLHTNMRLLMSSSNQHDGQMKRLANWILDIENRNFGSAVGDESEVSFFMIKQHF